VEDTELSEKVLIKLAGGKEWITVDSEDLGFTPDIKKIKPESKNWNIEPDKDLKGNRVDAEMKELYESGDYVCYYYIEVKNIWKKLPSSMQPYMKDTCRLIHKKHKAIADAVVNDSDVKVEFCLRNRECFISDFFLNYEEIYNYRLKHYTLNPDDSRYKEEYRSIEQVCDNPDVNSLKNKSILEENDLLKGQTISITSDDGTVSRVEIIGINGREFSKTLKDSTYTISIQDKGRTIKLFETPIKTKWHEDESNFPALIVGINDNKINLIETVKDCINFNMDNLRLATKQERDSLHCEE